MGSVPGSSEILLLLGMLDEAYSVKTWHGPNLKGSLRGLTAAAAAWKPDRCAGCPGYMDALGQPTGRGFQFQGSTGGRPGWRAQAVIRSSRPET